MSCLFLLFVNSIRIKNCFICWALVWVFTFNSLSSYQTQNILNLKKVQMLRLLFEKLAKFDHYIRSPFFRFARLFVRLHYMWLCLRGIKPEEANLIQKDIWNTQIKIDFRLIICVERIYLYCFHNIKYLLWYLLLGYFNLRHIWQIL